MMTEIDDATSIGATPGHQVLVQPYLCDRKSTLRIVQRKSGMKHHVFRTLLAILLMMFGVAGDGMEKKERKEHLMSTGETPAAYIERKIKTHEVMVFARSYGKQNEQAKSLLKTISHETSTSVEFLDLDLLEGWDGTLLLLHLEMMTGQWALPNIFIGQKHVGGNAEIDQLHAIGDLKEIVRQAGQEL